MARLTPDRPASDRRLAVGLAAGLVVALVALGLARIATGGWAPLAPDDARYLYVGLSVLDGHGPIGPNGALFLLRSPVYGVALAIGASVVVLLGGDPIGGARGLAFALGLLGLLGACGLAWRLAGRGAAVGAAVGLIATPLLWVLVPSLRIDLTQTAAMLAGLFALTRPTTRRWVLGGALIGIAILVKETAAPLLILPVALVGTVPRPRLVRLASSFVAAAVLVTAWWWVVVWLSTGQVFPLNALSVIELRDVDGPLRLDRSALPLLGAMVGGWGLVAWRARVDFGARLLLLAGLAIAPAALYAASRGLNARNFAGPAVLSAVALGVGGAALVAALVAAMGAGADRPTVGSGRFPRPTRSLATIALAGVALVAVALPVVGQRDVGRLPPDRLSGQVAAWLGTNVPDGARLVMAFREREETALRRYGHGEVAVLPVVRVAATDAAEAYLWMGLRDRQLFGYRRADWAATLTDPPGELLVLVGPHPFTPFELTAGPGTLAALGLAPVTGFEADGDRAEIDRISPAQAATGARVVPLHLSAEAATAWLALRGGTTAANDLIAARPVLSGDDVAIRGLVDGLGGQACTIPDEAGSARLGPAGSCSR